MFTGHLHALKHIHIRQVFIVNIINIVQTGFKFYNLQNINLHDHYYLYTAINVF